MGENTRNHYFTVDLDKPLSRQYVGLLLASGDDKGDEFFFTLERNGESITQSGAVYNASFIRSDGVTVTLDGVNSNGVVHVTLDRPCYNCAGRFVLTVKSTAAGNITTLAIIDGYIKRTATSSAVDPNEKIVSLPELMEMVGDLEQTTEEAKQAVTDINNSIGQVDGAVQSANNAIAELEQAKTSGEFDGKDGTSVTVKSVSQSSADGGSNVVTFSDGKTLTVKNGSKGSPGKDGNTPVKGIDYFDGAKGEPGDDYILTDADKEEIADLVPIVKVAETPKIVDSVDDMTDTTKHYVLDGDIWYYKKVVTEGEVTYPNVFDKSTATINGRLSVSTGAAASATTGSKGCFITDFIELKNWTDLSSYMVRVNFELQSTDIDANEVFFFDSSKALTGTYVHMFKAGTVVTIGNGKTSFDLKQWEAYSSAANAKYVKLRLYKKASGTALTTTDLNDVVITFDAYSVSSGGTESQQWVNSGIPYAPTFQTDLIGVLGVGNVVYLSDNLPAGTYTLKYGDEYDVIGSITVQ